MVIPVNRSIFPIWQLNLKSFLINFIFILFLYLFGFFGGGFVQCDDLIKIVYNNINIRYSFTLSSIRLQNSIDIFQNYIANTPTSQFKFKIFKYLQFDGSRFPRNCVYDHYHINLYLDNMSNVHYGCTLTHRPQSLGLSLNEFREISDQNLYEKEVTQYVLNHLHIYDLNRLTPENYTHVYNNYIATNKTQCTSQFIKWIYKN